MVHNNVILESSLTSTSGSETYVSYVWEYPRLHKSGGRAVTCTMHYACLLSTMHVYYAQSMSTMHKGPVTASRLHIIHVAPRQGHLRLETTHPFDPDTLPAVTSDTR